MPNFVIDRHFFPDNCCLVGSLLSLTEEGVKYLDGLIKSDNLENLVALQRIEDGRTLIRFSTLTPLGAFALSHSLEVGIADESLSRSRTIERRNLLSNCRNLDEIYRSLKHIIADPFTYYRSVENLDGVSLDEPLVEAEKIKTQEFLKSKDEYYHSRGEVSFSKQPNKLIFGENHGDDLATKSMQNMMGYFARNGMPIFLEFLPWEIFEPILQEYYSSEIGSERFNKSQDLLELFASRIRRNDSGNKDLIDLIKQAREFGVRVFPAETIISFYQSNDILGGAKEGVRLPMSNYATYEIVREVSPDKFAILYGNNHLLESISPSLPEMLGAMSVSFFQRGFRTSEQDRFRTGVDVFCDSAQSAESLVSKIYSKLSRPSQSTNSQTSTQETIIVTSESQEETQRW